MPMVHVAGWLRARRRRSFGRPDQGLPGGEDGPVDPGWGVEEGEGPEVLPPEEVPDPPPGIWPPLTPEQPWRPIPDFPERPATGPVPGLPPARPGQGLPPQPGQPLPPTGEGGDEHPDTGFPPGAIWPPLPPGVHGHYLALVLIGGGGRGLHYRYIVVDADARPELPERPGQGLPRPPRPQPK